MIVETLTLGVLTNCIYDFLKMGITIETAKFKNFVDLKEQKISDDIADEVVAVLQQDQTIKQLAQDGKEADVKSHIENSPLWSNIVTNISNQGTMIDNSINVAVGSNSGSGDVFGGSKTVHNTHYHGKDDSSKKP